MMEQQRFYSSNSWFSWWVQIYNRTFLHTPRIRYGIEFMVLIVQFILYLSDLMCDLNVLIAINDKAWIGFSIMLACFIVSPFIFQYCIFVQPMTQSHMKLPSKLLYFYFLFPIGVFYVVAIHIRVWFQRFLNGARALFDGFRPPQDQFTSKLARTMEMSHVQFHAVPFYILTILLYAFIYLDQPVSRHLHRTFAFSLATSALQCIWTYHTYYQEKTHLLCNFLEYLTLLFVNFFDSIPALNDVAKLRSRTLSLVGVALSPRKLLRLAGLFQAHNCIDAVLLDAAVFRDEELFAQLWRLVRGRKVHFLKYKNGKEIAESDSFRGKTWTEASFCATVGTDENWLWWETRVGPGVPLTVEGLARMCFEGAQFVPALYVSMSELLKDPGLDLHHRFAQVQDCIWQMEFAHPPTKKVHMENAMTHLACLNHRLLEEVELPGCTISTMDMRCLSLPELRHLNLEATNFKELKLVGELHKLERLNLAQCPNLATDGLDALHWPALRSLNLRDSSFAPLRLLRDLQSIESLCLAGCKHLAVKSPFLKLHWPVLGQLDLSDSSFVDLQLLGNLPQLHHVDLSDCTSLRSSSQHARQNLQWPKCETLILDGSSFDSFDLLSDLPSLMYFSAINCRHLNTKKVQHLAWPKIEAILLSKSNFDNVSLLRTFRSLETLELDYCNQLNTFGFGRGLPEWRALRDLRLDHSAFYDLSLLQDLPMLEEVTLHHCRKLLAFADWDDCRLDWPRARRVDIEPDKFDRLNIESNYMADVCLHMEEHWGWSSVYEAGDAHNLCPRWKDAFSDEQERESTRDAGLFDCTNSATDGRTASIIGSELEVVNVLCQSIQSMECGSPYALLGSGATAEPARRGAGPGPGELLVDQPFIHLLEQADTITGAESAFVCENMGKPELTIEDLLLAKESDPASSASGGAEQGLGALGAAEAELDQLLEIDVDYSLSNSETSRPSPGGKPEGSITKRVIDELLDRAAEFDPDSVLEAKSEAREDSDGDSVASDDLEIGGSVVLEGDRSSEVESACVSEGNEINDGDWMPVDSDGENTEEKEELDRLAPKSLTDGLEIVKVRWEENHGDESKESQEKESLSAPEVTQPAPFVQSILAPSQAEPALPAPHPLACTPVPAEKADPGKSKEPREEEDEKTEENAKSEGEGPRLEAIAKTYQPTVPCRYFHEGRCTRGENCTFLHVKAGENIPLPSTVHEKPTKYCRFFRRGQCTKGKYCTFIHDLQHIVPMKTKICKYHQQGNCLKGEHCTFIHDSQNKEDVIQEVKAFVKLYQHGDQGALLAKLLKNINLEHAKFGYEKAIDFVNDIPEIKIKRNPRVELFLSDGSPKSSQAKPKKGDPVYDSVSDFSRPSTKTVQKCITRPLDFERRRNPFHPIPPSLTTPLYDPANPMLPYQPSATFVPRMPVMFRRGLQD